VHVPSPGRPAPREARCPCRTTCWHGVRAVPRSGAPARHNGPSAALLPRAPYYGQRSSPVVTRARRAAYLRSCPSLARAAIAIAARHCRSLVNSPLHSSPVLSNCPKLLPRSHRSLSHRSLLGIAPPPLEPQPAAAATAVRSRRIRVRADQPLQSTLGEPLGGLAPLVGQGRPAIAAGEPTRGGRAYV
jgi:hypothetical protein